MLIRIPQHWINAAIQAATIVMLVIAILTLNTDIESNKSTDKLLQNVSRLVETNSKQVTILESTLKEIQHQTIVNAYVNSGILDVDFEWCHTQEVTEFGETVPREFLTLRPIIVSEKGAQTMVPARIFADLEFTGKENLSDNGRQYGDIHLGTYVYNPFEEVDVKEYPIQERLDEIKKDGYKYVVVDYEYSFTPFSHIKDQPIALQTKTQSKTLAIFEFDNGKYEVKQIPEMAVCEN